MSAVIARAFVVFRRHGISHFGVGQEFVVTAYRLLETFGRQCPGHPVRYFGLRIIGNRITRMANHLAVSLAQTQLTWGGYGKDIPALGNCSDGLTCSMNGKQNTEAIINYGKANSVSYPAAEYCVAYKPSTVYQDETWYAAGAWFLPSVKELNTLYANKAAVNAALTKVNATTLGNEYYWSSTEYIYNYAWRLRMSDGYRDWSTKYNYTYYVRPVLAF